MDQSKIAIDVSNERNDAFKDEEVSNSLIIEEYKQVRSVIAKSIESIEKTEVYITGSVGVTSVFAAAAKEQTIAICASIVVLILPMLGALRYHGMRLNLNIARNYIINIEKQVDGLGYSSFYVATNRNFLRTTRYGVYAALFAFGLILTGYVYFRAPIVKTPAASTASTPSFAFE